MGRKPRVDRTPEEKWQIVQEGMKSGNVSETCRRYGIAQTLCYRWKDEAELHGDAGTAGHHAPPYIERFHRSLKEEEVWTTEYRNLQEARGSIARWIEEYNHDRPHYGVGNRTPNEVFLSFAVLTKNEALTV